MPQSPVCTTTQSMLDHQWGLCWFSARGAQNPQGSPNVGSGVREELGGEGQWESAWDWEEGGGQGEEMEYLWRNQME